MTVWKDTRLSATTSAQAAVAFLRGRTPRTTGTVPNKGKRTPAFIHQPVSINKANYKVLFRRGYLKRSEVCRGQYAKYCT